MHSTILEVKFNPPRGHSPSSSFSSSSSLWPLGLACAPKPGWSGWPHTHRSAAEGKLIACLSFDQLVFDSLLHLQPVRKEECDYQSIIKMCRKHHSLLFPPLNGLKFDWWWVQHTQKCDAYVPGHWGSRQSQDTQPHDVLKPRTLCQLFVHLCFFSCTKNG